MKTLIIVLLVLLVAALIVLAVVLVRLARRGYQRYTGLERQRDSAKQSRVAGADRLKGAERRLVEAQRVLGARRAHSDAQDVERLRSRLSTLADRLRYATYGYSPLGSANPVRENELAEIQQNDADTIADAQAIRDTADEICRRASAGETPDLVPLASALDLLQESLDRRRAAS